MRRLILIALPVIITIAVYSAAFAGPLEDAKAAIDRGDYQTALKLVRPLADQGDAHAQRDLGILYSKGLGGVPQDDTEAAKWYRKAADQGDAKAQHLLSALYVTGQGVPQDYTEATKWSRKAADQGFAGAQYLLGIMFYHGTGVPQDYAEAAKWFRKAADQGNADAKHDLDVMSANGQGVTQDDAESADQDVPQNSEKPHDWREVPACDDEAIKKRLPSEVQARLQQDALQDPSPSKFVRLQTSEYTLSVGEETDDKKHLKRMCDLIIVFTGGQAPEQYHYTISLKDIGKNHYVDLKINKGFYAAKTKQGD
jgi:hypothetical protein